MAVVVVQQHLLHRGLDGRPRHRGGDERRRPERREVAEQRRRDRRLDSGDAADGARRRRVEPLRIGDADHRATRWCRACTSRTSSSGRRSPSRSAASKADRRWARRSRTRGAPCRARSSAAGAIITVLYIVATLAVLLAMPKDQVSGLQGIMQAIQAMTAKVGVGWLAPIVAALVTLNALGGVGGWFAATARLPFVAGHRSLPAEGVRRSASDVADAVRRAAGAGGDRRPLRVPRSGGDVGARRLRRARVDGDHRVFHPVPVHVRGDDRAAARAGGPRRDARARRQAGRDRCWPRPASSSPRSRSCWRAFRRTTSRTRCWRW